MKILINPATPIFRKRLSTASNKSSSTVNVDSDDIYSMESVIYVTELSDSPERAYEFTGEGGSFGGGGSSGDW